MIEPVTIYLGGPIDDITFAEAQDWREQVARDAPTGVLFFNPQLAWHGVGAATAAAVDYGNRGALLLSDGLLVNLGGPGRGFGTIREIEFARMHNRPVAVAQGDTEIESLLTHDLLLHRTVAEALDDLIETIRSMQNAQRRHPLAMLLGGFKPPEEQE